LLQNEHVRRWKRHAKSSQTSRIQVYRYAAGSIQLLLHFEQTSQAIPVFMYGTYSVQKLLDGNISLETGFLVAT
jgi:hypothetical protein